MKETQSQLKLCLQCGGTLFGRQRLYCSEAHEKAYKRAKAKSIGKSLSSYADKNLSVLALSSAELNALTDNLTSLIRWQRLNESNPHSEERQKAHQLTADILQIVCTGVQNYA